MKVSDVVSRALPAECTLEQYKFVTAWAHSREGMQRICVQFSSKVLGSCGQFASCWQAQLPLALARVQAMGNADRRFVVFRVGKLHSPAVQRQAIHLDVSNLCRTFNINKPSTSSAALSL